jgi:polar amino acid transport system substrate-binding protein
MKTIAPLIGALLCSLYGNAAAITIGAENDWYPYSAVRDGKPAGMAVDIVRAAYAAAGVQVELVSLPYARCMKLTEANKLAGCFDTLRNPLLENRYLWHKQPLFRGRIDIYAPMSAPDVPVTLADLRGKLIAVTDGYDYGAQFDGDKTMRRDMGDSDLFALRKLAAGRVDYALVYDRIVSSTLREHPELDGQFKSVGTLIEPDIYISFARRFPDVKSAIALFDAGMEKIRASGEYDQITQRWR